MKILMINVCCATGSTGRMCADIAETLIRDGHDVKIAYGRDIEPERLKGIAVRIGSDLDVYLHGIQARLFGSYGFGSTRATRKFVEWIKEYDPDIIHLHNIHGYYLNVEVLARYLQTCGKRIIWTFHDSWPFTGHSVYCDAIGCEQWKTGCQSCKLIGDYPISYTDRSRKNWLKKKAAFSGIPNLTITTPSEWLYGLVKQSFFGSCDVKVINNGIDTAVFCPTASDFREKHNLEGKTILLGVASSWSDMKGLSDYYKLARMLEDSYQIVLVGLKEKQLEEIPAGIIGITKTDSVSDLAALYSAADAFLNLTYCDNYPTVNIEALSCGTPVITYDTGGSSEIVRQCGGYVVPRGDLTALVDCIRSYRKDQVPLAFDREKNSVTSKVKDYIDLYFS